MNLFPRPNGGVNKEALSSTRSIRIAVREGQPHVKAHHDQPSTTTLGAAWWGVDGSYGVANVGTIHDDDEHVADAQEKIYLKPNLTF
ncbi:hypothetical protein FXO37_31567 [Capsicum annuum]|nr:hypothetical protein FXO37_31567 [Capsicum annuum]